MNGDGIADLLIANSSQDNDVNSNLGILHAKGEGVFQALVPTPALQFPVATDGLAAFAVAVGDFNKDNKPDMAVVYPTAMTRRLFESTTFATPTTTSTNTPPSLLQRWRRRRSRLTPPSRRPQADRSTKAFLTFASLGGKDVNAAVVTPTVTNGFARFPFCAAEHARRHIHDDAGYSGGAVLPRATMVQNTDDPSLRW
jgi:hypothetical protein